MIKAMRIHKYALKFVHESLKKERMIVLESVKEDGRPLRFAHEALKR